MITEDIMNNYDTQITQLTPEEKAALLSGVDSWCTNSIDRLDIPSLFLTDGPHGLRKVRNAEGGFAISENEHSTSFPTSVTLASSWNPENAYKMGAAIANECTESKVHVLLAPGVNIKRSPLCGRNFEYYSEDPLVSGVFGEAFVKGVQSRGVACSLKHFAVNSNENHRFNGNSVLDERAYREIYLKAFEHIVKKADPATIMCSYNRINGVYASENKELLTDILRNEWGYKGLVMTDWGAITSDRIKTLDAGCDLEMPGDSWHTRSQIIEELKGNSPGTTSINRSVGRMLNLIDRYGSTNMINTSEDFIKSHSLLSCDIAIDSAVLLKNDHILPLDRSDKILVVGELFENMRFQGAGSSLINPPEVITPKDAFDKRNVVYTYTTGYRLFYPEIDPNLEQEALKAANDFDTILFFGGLNDFEESEGFDRTHMRLGDNQLSLLNKLIDTGKKIIFVMFTGSPVELPFIDRISGLLNMYLPGMYGGEATAALLFGEANPSGRLAETWPIALSDTSSYDDYNKSKISKYYESIYVGYRFYKTAGTKCRFPFGYGLSYSEFTYDSIRVSEDDQRVVATVTLTNTSNIPGSEVVQLYIRNNTDGVFKASLELLDFKKISLSSGESRDVTLTFAKSQLAYWNIREKSWVIENGCYQVLAGPNVDTLPLRHDLTITDQPQVEQPYNQAVINDYQLPPNHIPDSFSELVGFSIDEEVNAKPFTENSTLRDLKHSMIGGIFSKSVLTFIEKDYKKALKMEDSIERNSLLKNSHFVFRMMPSNTLRSMAMSSSGKFDYRIAQALVHFCNGKFIEGFKVMLTKDPKIPVPSKSKEK